MSLLATVATVEAVAATGAATAALLDAAYWRARARRLARQVNVRNAIMRVMAGHLISNLFELNRRGRAIDRIQEETASG